MNNPSNPFHLSLLAVAQSNEPTLLGLPEEIRRLIYAHAFPDDTVIPISTTYKPPGILLACRQTYVEGVEMFYATTTFLVGTKPGCLEWLTALSPRVVPWIADIHVHNVMTVECRLLDAWRGYRGQILPGAAEYADNARLYLRSDVLSATGTLLGEQVLKVQVLLKTGAVVWSAEPLKAWQESFVAWQESSVAMRETSLTQHESDWDNFYELD